jgi:hypothetical protein
VRIFIHLPPEVVPPGLSLTPAQPKVSKQQVAVVVASKTSFQQWRVRWDPLAPLRWNHFTASS